MDEREVVGSEFVVARLYATTVLDLVEELLDPIPGSIEIRAEADRIVAIGAQWNVDQRTFLSGKRSNPVRIIAPVGITFNLENARTK